MTYPEVDIEDNTEQTPMLGSSSTLLGSSSHQRRAREQQDYESNDDSSSAMWTVLRFFGGGIYAPDASTFDPIELLLNAEEGEDQDELTIKWRDNKLSELSFVGVVVGIWRESHSSFFLSPGFCSSNYPVATQFITCIPWKKNSTT